MNDDADEMWLLMKILMGVGCVAFVIAIILLVIAAYQT